jgi:hypothetical protein
MTVKRVMNLIQAEIKEGERRLNYFVNNYEACKIIQPRVNALRDLLQVIEAEIENENEKRCKKKNS